MRKFICFILSSLLLAACVGEDSIPMNGTGKQEGSSTEATPADSIGYFELTLTGERDTRATQTVISKEEAELFLVTIYKGTDIVRSRTYLKDVNTSLAAGYGYRVFAESVSEETAITSNEGWGQRRYAGYSPSFAIKSGETTPVNVGCSVANAGFEVIFDESVAEYFTTSYSITVRDGDRTLVFDSTTGGKKVDGNITTGKVAYFNIGKDGHHTVSYTIRAVGPKTIEKTGTLDLSKAIISRINLNYERSEFDFRITLDEEQIFVDDIINITDEDIQVENGATEILASHEPFVNDAAAITTRTALAADGLAVNWSENDAIAVFDFTAAKHEFPIEIGNDGRTKFEGRVTPKSPTFAAVYPFSVAAETAASAANLSATLPTTQYAVAGGFESDQNVSVAKGDRHLDGSPTQVTFYNATQLLRFRVPDYAADQISSITLTAPTAIAGKLTIDYSQDRPSTTIGSSESKVITLLPPRRSSAFPAGTYYIITAPTQLESLTLALSTSSKNYSETSSPAFGGTASHIYNLGTLDLVKTPTATATHVYTDGVLQGTKVQLTDAPIEGRAWSADITDASGTTVRSVAGTGDLTSDEKDADWPYLPKGNYTVNYSYTSSDGDARTGEVTLNVPAPTLTLAVDGYSAHTKYEQGDVAAANACERLTVYSPSATFSVADALLANSHYTHSYVRTFNGQSATTSETTNAPTWANYTNVSVSGNLYTLSVTANFAGETATASKTFRITGLPVTFAPPTNSNWTSSGTVSWSNSEVRLGRRGGLLTERNEYIRNTSSVNIPAGTRMALDYDISIHPATVGTTFSVACGSQTIFSKEQSGGAANSSDYPYKGTSDIITTSGTVTQLQCNNTYGGGQTCSHVYSLTFKYGK